MEVLRDRFTADGQRERLCGSRPSGSASIGVGSEQASEKCGDGRNDECIASAG